MNIKDTIETNFIPLDLTVDNQPQGLKIGEIPATNTANTNQTSPNNTPANSNIIPSGGGSIVKGFLKTQNYNVGVSGWSINEDGSVDFSDGKFTGTINATAGYFGNVTNGISIASNGLLINGSGYIRTAATGARVEIIKQIGGGFDEGITLYDANENLNFRLCNGNPYLSLNIGGVDNGVAQFSSAHSTTTWTNTKITSGGANIALELITSGTASGRAGKGSINIANTATYGNSLRISHGADCLGEIIYLTPNIKTGVNILIITDTSWTSTHEARITNESYLQFPSYYHCSDFDENLAGNTAIASTIIANAYWTGGGTSGTQTLIIGGAEDENTYVNLSTTSTASRSSTLTFGRYIDMMNQGCLEFRFRINNMTNTAMKFGCYYDSTHYAYFAFDTAVHASLIYFATNDGASSASASTGIEINTTGWHTLRMTLYAGNLYALFIDDIIVTAGTQYTTFGKAKPYIYVDNKAASEEKIIYLDYVKIWAGRDNGSAVA